MAELKEQLRVHNVLQYYARQDFYRRHEYAPEHSDKFTLLAADGTFAVLFPTVPQDSSFKRAKLICNVFTVVDYSHPTDRDHVFLSIRADGSEDANSEISFIHAHIQRLCNAGQLAARLELQLDNRLSEKNRWMLAYLGGISYFNVQSDAGLLGSTYCVGLGQGGSGLLLGCGPHTQAY